MNEGFKTQQLSSLNDLGWSPILCRGFKWPLSFYTSPRLIFFHLHSGCLSSSVKPSDLLPPRFPFYLRQTLYVRLLVSVYMDARNLPAQQSKYMYNISVSKQSV